MCLGSTTKFLMSFLTQNASFSSKFRSLFSVIRHNHSVLFMKLYMLLTKGPIKVQIFRLSSAKVNQIPSVIFQTTIQRFFKYCIILLCHATKLLYNSLAQTLYLVYWRITPLYFFSSNIINFSPKDPIKVQILRLSSVGSKFAKSLISFSKVSSSSNFASFFSVIIHNSSVPFWLKHNLLLIKVAHQSENFQFSKWDLPMLALKFTKFLMPFLEPTVSLFFKLCINLHCHETELFRTFSFKTLYALNKRIPSKCKFSGFWLLARILTNFLMSFFKTLHHSLVSWHIIPVKFSSWNIVCFEQKESIKV